MEDLARHMAGVAKRLLGEPNPALSSAREWRYGSRGSLAVDLEKGTFFDHEQGEGGGVLALISCKTGKTNGAAMAWLEAEGFTGARASRGRWEDRIARTYDYRDEAGDLLFQVVRLADPKDFRQRRPDPSAPGGWIWKTKGVRQVPYRLPELLEAAEGAVLFIAEGEKDADRLAALGLHATTNPGGAGKWRDDLADPLTGFRICVLADNDTPGREHAEAIASSFRKRGAPAAVLQLDGLPPKGDVSDWLDAGGDADRLCALAEAALGGGQSLLAPVADLAGRPVPPRDWHVEGLIPGATVTMLGGDGGTGKSLLGAQLAAATALGGKWIGREPKPGPAIYLSAEDDDAELHRRFADIARAEGVGLAAFTDLHHRSLAGEDALLAVLNQKTRALAPTPLYEGLSAAMAELQPVLLVLDTLADLHGGEENNRAHARQFVGLLRGLAIRHGCAVLVLAHPSLTGMASGSGLSGSTAWNASVRSRLYLERIIEEGGYEADPDARRLAVKKNNYARTGGEIGLRWHDGVFVTDAPESGLDRMAATAKAERVFLKLLRLHQDQGRHVSPSPGPNYGPAVFARHPDAEGVTKRALTAAMEQLLNAGRIKVAKHGRPSKERSHIAFAEEVAA